MRYVRWSALAAGLSLVVSATTVGQSHAATSGAAQATTAAQVEGAIGQLRATGYALDEEGRKGGEAAVWGGTAFDTVAGKVDLYLADTGQYQRFLAAARVGHSGVDPSLVQLHSAKFSHAKLVEARNRTMTPDRMKFGFATNSFIVPEDGSGLVVGVADAADQPLSAAQMTDAASKLTAVAGVPVTVQYVKLSQNKDRTADTSPYYAGGLIHVRHSDGTIHSCTMGFAENSGSTTYVFTAAHCAHAGDVVMNGNNVVEGTTIAKNDASDSALIDARGGFLEFDGGQSSYNVFGYGGQSAPIKGDVVYQDGYVSGIKASQVSLTYVCWWATSSYGVTNSCGSVSTAFSGNAVQSGDSGALVFHCYGSCSNGRYVAGLVSANYGSDTELAYTTVNDILSYWGGSV